MIVHYYRHLYFSYILRYSLSSQGKESTSNQPGDHPFGLPQPGNVFPALGEELYAVVCMWLKWKTKGDIQPAGHRHFRSLCSRLFRYLSMPEFSDFPGDQRKKSPFVTEATSSLPDTLARYFFPLLEDRWTSYLLPSSDNFPNLHNLPIIITQ